MSRSLLYIAISIFIMPLFVLSGYIPSSAPSTLLLAVLEHLGVFFLSAVICAVSNWIANFAFPSYTFPAYSSFGTVKFIVIRLLMLLSRCESINNASISPTCALPFLVTWAMCVSQEQYFEISTPRYVYWCTIGTYFVFSPIPTGIYRVHLIFDTYNHCALLDVRRHPPFPVKATLTPKRPSVPGFPVTPISRCFFYRNRKKNVSIF